MPPPLLVHAFEIGVTQQPRIAGKGAAPRHHSPRHGNMIRFSRHTGSHSDSNSRSLFPISNDECRSSVRNSGFTRTHRPASLGLIAESWFYRDPFAPLGAPAGNYFLAALGLHALAKSVCLRSLAPVGLECTLGHEKYVLLIRSTVLGQTISINHPRHYLQTAPLPISAQSDFLCDLCAIFFATFAVKSS